MAISIVPKDKLITVFNVLLEGYKSKFPLFFRISQILPFVDYFQKQWLRRDSIIGDWNLYDRSGFHTNNYVEGYNHLLKQKVGVHRPFWEFLQSIQLLYAEEQLNYEKYTSGTDVSGSVRKPPLQSRRATLGRLKLDFLKGPPTVDRCIHYLQHARSAMYRDWLHVPEETTAEDTFFAEEEATIAGEDTPISHYTTTDDYILTVPGYVQHHALTTIYSCSSQ
jgi:hypothetical protein